MPVDKKTFTLCQFNINGQVIKLLQNTFLTLEQAKVKNRLLKTVDVNTFWLEEKIAEKKIQEYYQEQECDVIPLISDNNQLLQFCDRVIDQAQILSNKSDLTIMESNDLRSLALESAPALAENLKRFLSEEITENENH